MDRLDILSIASIAALALAILFMLTNQGVVAGRQHNSAALARENAAYAAQVEADKKIFQGVASFMEKGLYSEASASLDGIMKKYPDKSLSYVYLAQLDLKQGKLGKSVHNYRKAVEMQPDYVDKKTPLYQGEEITKVVKEGMDKFEREKALKPDDKAVKRALKNVYYLQRRMAGGCE